MKKTFKFIPPIIRSTASKMDLDAWDRSMKNYDEKKYLDCFYDLLDYINPEFRKKYGNKEQTEFIIPHGSIVVNIKIDGDTINIDAPFLKIPKENRVPLLRQVADLNMNGMLLTQIYLRGEELFFKYSCPVSLVEPYKMYYTLEDICYCGDRYDDEFVTKFGATNLSEPRVEAYDEKTIDSIYNNIQALGKECLENEEEFEKDRKYGSAWNVINTTLMQILYFANPQGQLLNDMNKAMWDMNRDEKTPLATIVSDGKDELQKIMNMSKEELAADLYFVETFIPPKRRSNLQNIQENFKGTYERVTDLYSQGDFMNVCILIINKFYQLYYYNNVQDNINDVVVNALKETGDKEWDKAAPTLYKAMKNIMEGNLSSKGSGGFFSKLFGK